MSGATDLSGSERGVFCIALVIIATVLIFLRRLSGAEWVAFAQWVVTVLVAGKTVTGVVERRAAKEA